VDSIKSADTRTNEELLDAAPYGDEGALAVLVERHRGCLERMIRLRADRRLQGRVDPADVVQEAYLAARGEPSQYCAKPRLPFFMDPHDREVPILRHFEGPSNAEAAQVPGIKPSAAVNRGVRALRRPKEVFDGMPGGIEEIRG
jgi:DNA-directed RNA polymerase specialized sigma24 family protein